MAQLTTIWTIGHSTRPLDEFLALLARHGLTAVADVRRFPASRRHPQYAQATLRAALSDRGIAYDWFPGLGGRRQPLPDSPNTAWRNRSFRGYADHMASEDFAAAFAALLEFCTSRHGAILCAEALWWRCHRALIADALRVRGIKVLHILQGDKVVAHPFTAAARVIGGQLDYSLSGQKSLI
jgi:uncharacterized protein (DUF488 family)